ncbi:pyridoxal-dependent decarboxylase [Acidiplasma cupricumulans]|uniref:pyridoxal-dependent decarboxylase n=1 Tax=Acidiplasma cupricumulans TaxID=312540 RepID=UPI000784AC3F|nr:pyridoxal-dependent decarboxylase [Acidiplasma cupricumulans]
MGFQAKSCGLNNVSGHKFGLVYPGLGWLIFRDKKYLPEDLIFYVNYLGNEMPTYTLNFSRSASNIAAQYYNILRMGISGYKRIAENMMANARYLASEIKKMDNIELVSSAEHIPVITFKQKHKDAFDLFDLSSELRKFGWIIPAYSLPDNASGTVLMRIVVRESFSRDMANLLINNIKQALNNMGRRQKFEMKSPRRGHAVT